MTITVFGFNQLCSFYQIAVINFPWVLF